MNGISDLVVSWRAIWLARQAFRSSQLVENSFRPIANFENYWRTRSKYATSFLRTCSEFGNRVLWLAVISNSQSKLIEMRFDWLIFLQPIITRILKISLYFITSLIRSIQWCTSLRWKRLGHWNSVPRSIWLHCDSLSSIWLIVSRSDESRCDLHVPSASLRMVLITSLR